MHYKKRTTCICNGRQLIGASSSYKYKLEQFLSKSDFPK